MYAFIRYHALSLTGIVYCLAWTIYDAVWSPLPWTAAVMAFFLGVCSMSLYRSERARRQLRAAEAARAEALTEFETQIRALRADFDLP